MTTDPFEIHYDVAVPGGALHVARLGPPPAEADAVVLAAHGITASHVAWRTVARQLAADEGISVLAPDLRGRGRSAVLPGPFGIAAHVADLVAVLDDAGVGAAVLAGHSMGGYAVARLAGEHPDRATALVLADGGVALAPPPGADPSEVLAASLGPSIARLALTWPSLDSYIAMWRLHPSLARVWDDDVEAYVRYDVADALDSVSAPVHLLCAERGVIDEDAAMISDEFLRDFALTHPDVEVERIDGVNHYTLILGPGPGASHVAAAIEAAHMRAAATT